MVNNDLRRARRCNDLINNRLLEDNVRMDLNNDLSAMEIAARVRNINVRNSSFLLQRGHLRLRNSSPLLTLSSRRTRCERLTRRSHEVLQASTRRVLYRLLHSNEDAATVIVRRYVLNDDGGTSEISASVLMRALVLNVCRDLRRNEIRLIMFCEDAVLVRVLASRLTVNAVGREDLKDLEVRGA